MLQQLIGDSKAMEVEAFPGPGRAWPSLAEQNAWDPAECLTGTLGDPLTACCEATHAESTAQEDYEVRCIAEFLSCFGCYSPQRRLPKGPPWLVSKCRLQATAFAAHQRAHQASVEAKTKDITDKDAEKGATEASLVEARG